MTTEALPNRMDTSTFVPIAEHSDDSLPLHERAETLLDYPHARLLTELVTLGITPFSRASVEKYKARQAKNHSTGLRATKGCTILFSIFLFSAFSTYVFLSRVVLPATGWNAIALAVSSVIPILVTCFFVGATGSLAFDGDGLYKTKATWKLIPIGKYNEELPLSALQTATVVMEAVPDAEILIDELAMNEVPVDPFLVVRLGATTYHLEVWDEPGFDQRLMTI